MVRRAAQVALSVHIKATGIGNANDRHLKPAASNSHGMKTIIHTKDLTMSSER